MEIKAECSNCGQHVLLDDSAIGQPFVCPNCHQSVIARAAMPKAAVAPAKEVQTNVRQSAALGGWICFGVAAVVLFIPLPTWFIYVPLFLVSFILGIVAMAQGRVASGLTLILANVIGGPVLVVVAWVLGLATWGTAFHEMAKLNTPAEATNTAAVPVQAPESLKTNAVSTPAVSPPAPAVATFSKIEGAFGLKLGEIFDPSSAVDTGKLPDGTPTYEFNSATPFRSFDHYYVLITPTTHKIYSICAMESFDNQETAQKEQAVVMEMLKGKYGPESPQGVSDTLENAEVIEQGNRRVGAKVNGFTDVTLVLLYNDGDLEKQAEQERVAGEVQGTDKTGL